MSFMFKPLAYDDPDAVNHIPALPELTQGLTEDTAELAARIVKACGSTARAVVAIDGYVSASFEPLVKAIQKQEEDRGKTVRLLDMRTCYYPQNMIDEMTKENLPENPEDDPVLLFGLIYEGCIEDFICRDKAEAYLDEGNADLTVIYGLGSLCSFIRNRADVKVYVDVTPKVAAIRAREKKYVNIGDEEGRPFHLLMRRNYYVDFEVVLKLRKELFLTNQLDYYLLGNDDDHYTAAEWDSFTIILQRLASRPFRAKPVYLEGIWGGEFIRKVRSIPQDIASNIAWIFEFIPMEVSIVAKIGDIELDIPFFTFLQNQGSRIMGETCLKEFEGYFPVRFNYDDTWHSNGNMSIQVHPDEDFAIEQYHEFGRQDEAYYVIATGHGARTYCGFKGDGKAFLEKCRESEQNHQDIDYEAYIHSVESVPGTQIMLPAGTIHASGRNQFILELGSLTIGSYTYKVYDYNRKDKDGAARPIHTKNADRVLQYERDSGWVKSHAAISPELLETGADYKEYVVGKTDLMYYETHRIELQTYGTYYGKNHGQFTVITVADGEQIFIYSKTNPEACYEAGYLDIITIPADIEDYVIEARGYQPVVLHKTILKDGYARYKNQDWKKRRD